MLAVPVVLHARIVGVGLRQRVMHLHRHRVLRRVLRKVVNIIIINPSAHARDSHQWVVPRNNSTPALRNKFPYYIEELFVKYNENSNIGTKQQSNYDFNLGYCLS